MDQGVRACCRAHTHTTGWVPAVSSAAPPARPSLLMANAWAAWPASRGGNSSAKLRPFQISAANGRTGQGLTMELSDAVPTATLLSLSAANLASARLPNRPPTTAPTPVGEGQKNGLD